MKSNTSLMWKTKADLTKWLLTLFGGTGILFLGRMSMAICEVQIKEEFNWNDEQLGRVMSVFFWGYATTQVLGGSGADLFGGDTTIVLSSLLWGSICFLTPFFTYLSFAFLGAQAAFYMIIFLRILMGMSQGIHFPSLSSLLARRVAETNRSFSMSFVSCGGQFGTLLCGFVGSMLLDWTSWKFVFNVFGALGVGFSYFLYNLKKKQKQLAHRVVSLDALEDSPLIRSSGAGPNSGYFKGKNSVSSRVLDSTKSALTKVRSIFFKRNFVSLVLAHMASTNYTFILSFWLPKFFYDKYKHTNIQPWHYNVIPWIGVIPGAVVSGVLSDALVKRTNLSLTSIRKIIEVIALIGSALFLHPLTKIDSNTSAANAYDILSYTQNYFSPGPIAGVNVQRGVPSSQEEDNRRRRINRSVDQLMNNIKEVEKDQNSLSLNSDLRKLGETFEGEQGQGFQGQDQGKNDGNNNNKNNKNAIPEKDINLKNSNAKANLKSTVPIKSKPKNLNNSNNPQPTLPVESALFYITISIALSNFHAASAMVNPQDLAPQNAGSVFGVMNMMGAISSSFGIWFTGYLLDKYERQWGLVFNWIIIYNFIGGVMFLLFGTGKRMV